MWRANSVLQVHQAANESPAAAEFADCQHQFVAALLQGKVDGIVFRVNDPEESGIAKTLGAAATVENFAIQEYAHVVAVTDIELFHLIALGINVGSHIHHLHSRLRFQTLGKVSLKRDPRMWSFAITIEDHKSGWLRLHILPLDCLTFG